MKPLLDIANLQRDAGGAAGNQARWAFLLMWIVFADLLHGAFQLAPLYAVVGSAIVVALYRIIDGMRIVSKAMRTAKQPLEPMWDTRVEL